MLDFSSVVVLKHRHFWKEKNTNTTNPSGSEKKKNIVDSWYIPKWPPQKRRYFPYTECINFGRVRVRVSLTFAKLFSRRMAWPHRKEHWIEVASESSSWVVSAWKSQGLPTRNHSFWLPTRGTRGEFGARNENHVSKKVAKVSKKWRKTCFLCWWFSGSCIFVAGGWSFLWLVPFFLHRRIFLWALLSFDGACTPNNWTWPSQKMPWKDTFFFPSFFLSDTLNIRSIPQIYRVEVSFQLNVVVSWIRTRPRGGYSASCFASPLLPFLSILLGFFLAKTLG